MGFTIEDMNLMAKDRYHMEFIAGKRGWSNSISWVLMMEDTAIIRNFAGKELAVTTGLGFDTYNIMPFQNKVVPVHIAPDISTHILYYYRQTDPPGHAPVFF